MAELIQARIGFWAGGMNSSLHPADLPKGQYSYGENIVNRGGIVQTRPGLKYLTEIEGSRIQGFAMFTPKDSRATMLIAVDGRIYQAKPPFTAFSIIPDLLFTKDAEFIVFKECLQSVKQQASGRIELVDPIRLIIIQDGVTKPGCFDGVNAEHLDPNAPLHETPIGLWMEWTSSRLWVVAGTRVIASDIADPRHFTEEQYLAERSSFELPDVGTGIIETTDKSGLLAFTSDTTTAFQSAIRDRTLWQQTRDFQKLLLKRTGCVSGISPLNHYGLTYWQSKAGFISLDAAMQSESTSEVISADAPMMRPKSRLSTNLRGVATCAFENFLLLSVPVGSKYNAQTWVLDQSPSMEGGDGRQSRCWSGVWSGVRPAQWAVGPVAGRERCFFAAFDARSRNGTRIHIWEAFQPDRTDKGGRISCQFETHAIIPTGLKFRVKYIEFELAEIFGKVEVEAWVGGIRGPWIPILAKKTIIAEIGCIGSRTEPLITKGGLIRAYKPQTRTIRSVEFSTKLLGDTCSPETGKDGPGEDKGFIVLVQWRGQMGIRSICLYGDPTGDKQSGRCEEDEIAHIGVTEQGEVVK